MNFEPDFRSPNSNETVLAAAVAALIIVGLVWAMTEVFGDTAAAHAVAAPQAPLKRQSCPQWLHETRPAGCARAQGDEEKASTTR